MVTLRSNACRLIIGALLPLAALQPAKADVQPLYPFKAIYHLEASGWPSADVEHQLEKQSNGKWKAYMHTSATVAALTEYSTFHQQGDQLVADNFYSKSHLFGFGKTRVFAPDKTDASAKSPLPDRQALVIQVAMTQRDVPCQGVSTPSCHLDYLNQKQHKHSIDYRILGTKTLQTRMGSWPTVQIEVKDPKHPERLYEFYSDPRYPGLMVKVEYYKNGNLDSHMELTSFIPAAVHTNARQSSNGIPPSLTK